MKLLIVIFALLIPSMIFSQAEKSVKAQILITSGLKGGFSVSPDTAEGDDKLISLAQSIVRGQKGGALYIDLGNAFYPGPLSKYSFGSVMMDYFVYTKCVSTLVSSDDLRIGMDNLEFLKRSGGAPIVSANIFRGGSVVFSSHSVNEIGGRRVAFIGLSSDRILFDAAEKKAYDVKLEEDFKVLDGIIPPLKDSGIEHIVIISGRNYGDNIKMLQKYKDISMIIAGGDNWLKTFGNTAARFDLPDGRSLIGVPQSMDGYYRLDLTVGSALAVTGLNYKPAAFNKIDDQDYQEFIERISLWKRQFSEETGKTVADIGAAVMKLTEGRVANLMRDKYNAEVAIIREGSIIPLEKKGEVSARDFLSSIDDGYSLFTYEMTGAALKEFSKRKGYHFSGLTDGKIQGYPVIDARVYMAVSTQPVYEQAIAAAPGSVYENRWKNISEIVTDDLVRDKVILKDDFAYLENRFRILIKPNFSFFYEDSEVKIDKNVKVPPGKPKESFTKKGTEDWIDFTFYNRWHRFVLTPYVNYVNQNDVYLANLLRGTILYNLNLGYAVSPYNKFQADTLLFEVDRLRPAIVRETAGASIETANLTSRLGGGFEKQVADPERSMIYGFELYLKYKLDFFKYFIYTFTADSFATLNRKAPLKADQGYVRSSIENSLGIKITEMLFVDFKHRWFNYHALGFNEDYTQSQFITSAVFKTDFKIY